MKKYKEPKYYWELEQRTEEWHQLKAGVISATGAKFIMTKGTKNENNIGVGLDNNSFEKACELYYGPSESGYTNEHMQYGIDSEEQIIKDYCVDNFLIDAAECGFVMNSDDTGFSPDQMLFESFIELKTTTKYNILREYVSGGAKKHMPQVQFGMWVTGFKYATFLYYHPKVGTTEVRIERDNYYMDIFDEKVPHAVDLINRYLEALKSKK